jgi:cytochrome b involved in lipid metabolism
MTEAKNIFGVVAIVLVIAGGGFLLLRNTRSLAPATVETNNVSVTQAAPVVATQVSVADPVPASAYTLADVALHASAASCWTAISGSVYDVTSWIGRHPGGSAAILSLCGKDGTSVFTGQHGGQPRPASELAGFRIGALVR